MPDAVGWELKWYTDKTSLITEPDGPAATMRYDGQQAWLEGQQRLPELPSHHKGHGTKFRIVPESVCHLYMKKERV